MPRRDRLAVAVLGVIFVLAIGHLIIKNIEFGFNDPKDIFAEGVIGKISDINPLFVDINDTDRDVSHLIFSGLVKYDPITKNFLPDLAEKWEKSSDNRTYTFTLKENVFWHDGVQFGADDVIYTYKDIISYPFFRNPVLKETFNKIQISKNSNNSVSFKLPKANSYFISQLTTGIVPQHILESIPVASMEKANFGLHPIGTGPYSFTGMKTSEDGDYVDLEYFPKYYGEIPKIKHFRFYAFNDENTLLDTIRSLHSIAKVGKDSDLAKKIAESKQFVSHDYSLNQFTALFFNNDNIFLKDKKVRKALKLGLDKKALVAEGEREVDKLEMIENIKNTSSVSADPAKAASALEELGYKRGANGMRANLTMLVHTKTPKTVAESIKKQFGDLGVNITIKTAEKEDFYNMVAKREYDILLIRQNLGYNRDVYSLFHSSQIKGSAVATGGLNYAQFKSFQTDGLTEALRKEKDQRDKEKLLLELSKSIEDEVPVIFISTPIYSYFIDNSLQSWSIESLDFHSDRFTLIPYLPFNIL